MNTPLTLTFLPTGRYQCPGLGLARELMLEASLRQTGCQDCPVFKSCKMSHWTTMETQLTDLKALEGACLELGILLTRGPGEVRGYNRATTTADRVILCAGPYDIGVTVKKDGTLALFTDWWDGHVAKEVGKDYGKLLQLYGVHKATAAARAKYYRVVRSFNEATHEIKLTIHC